MNRNTVIDTLKQRGGFITTGEVKSRGEYEQLRRAKIQLLVGNKECFVLKVTENTNDIRNILRFIKL